MFIVFNKEKIYSYIVALSTVVILFVFAFIATNKTENTVQTSTNTQQDSEQNYINAIVEN